MNSAYLRDLNRTINEYRGCVDRAESIHRKFLDNPVRSLLLEEIRCYRDACEICSRAAAMFTSDDPQCAEWLGRQASNERKLRELLHIHDHGLPQKNDQDETVPTAAAPGKSGGTKAAQGGKSGGTKASQDDLAQEMVDGWFKERPKHGFDAVAGMNELKEKLRTCIQDVAASSVNQYLGMDVVHSFFLYGPPGCGKTFITKAFVHELMGDQFTYEGQPYKYMFLSGGDVHQALVGKSEKVVERAFQEAMNHAPCILFMDEIDSVCRNRSQAYLPTHAMNTTTAFLNGYNSLMDSPKPVIFIGATNYPNMVDGAMLDRVELIKVPLPDLEVRTFTFEKALGGILKNEDGFTYADMAEETDNFSQRDCNRLLGMLKRAVKDELKPLYGEDAEAMVEAMKSGSYRFTRELFMNVLKQYRPSRKEDILRDLDKWDADQARNDE